MIRPQSSCQGNSAPTPYDFVQSVFSGFDLSVHGEEAVMFVRYVNSSHPHQLPDEELDRAIEKAFGAAPENPVLPKRFERKTLRSLIESNPQVPYFFDALVALHEVLTIYGPVKSSKTTNALHIAICARTGKSVWGQFEAKRTGPVLFFSGESSEASLACTAAAMCEKMGVALDELDGLDIVSTVPNLTSMEDQRELAAELKDFEDGILIIDPLCIALPDLEMGNSSRVNHHLQRTIENCRKFNVTPILVHHTKDIPPGTPPRLDVCMWPAIRAHTAQWIGLNRANNRDYDGEHQLLVHVGGRAGHRSQWDVRIRDRLPSSAEPTWEVDLQRQTEHSGGSAEGRPKKKSQDPPRHKIEAAYEVMASAGRGGIAVNQLKSAPTKLRNDKGKRACQILVEEGRAEEFPVGDNIRYRVI